MASSVAATTADNLSGTSQTTPNIENQAKKSRWDGDEDKKISEIVKLQWHLEKDSSGKLNGTKFWTLISAKLKECGFDRTSEQCRSYWYGTLRVRQEFKDTLQFRSTGRPDGRNGTPTVAASKTLAAVNKESSKHRTRSDSAALFSTGAEESKAVSVAENNKMLQAMTATGDNLGSMYQAAAENGLGFMSETTGVIDDEGDTTISMSQPSTNNGTISRWTEPETQKLTELVSAKRSSMAKDGKGAGVGAFWKSISLDLENSQIHRSGHACMRRFSRINGDESGTVEPAMDPDATHSSLFYVEPYNDDKGQTTHPKSRIDHNDDDEADYDGSKSELDGDTPYGADEDGELRRGARKRVSRPAWTDEEHNRLVQLVKARRQLESEDPKLIKLNPSKLFALVSKQLKHYLIDRSGGACHVYWTSKGAARSGFDINSPFPPQEANQRSAQGLSPVGKDIEDAYSRLRHQDFDDSTVIQNFRKEHNEYLGIGKRPRGLGGIWDDDYYDEPNELDRAKRRRSEGDVLRNNENSQTTAASAGDILGTSPGMVKRRAPKRDPSLPLIKPHINVVSDQIGAFHVAAGTGDGSSGIYDPEFPMKMKIRDLESKISSLETSKQNTVSEIREDESKLHSIHNKIELLQVQKQKLQQSRREKEGQLDVYSSKIEKLTSQKKHLEVALDIVGGRA